MFTYYIIPSRTSYVQKKEDILSWEKTDNIDPAVPTCIVINDSIAKIRLRFVVVYKHKMQYTGGSGCCYNPTQEPSFLTNYADPMDNSKMPANMRKWIMFDWKYLYELAVSVKYELLFQIGLKDGMKLIDPSEIKEVNHKNKQKALPCGK